MIRAAIIGSALLTPMLALAQPPNKRDPNWPCQQIKVFDISLASIWSGPAVDPADVGWKNNAPVADLVEKLAPRRQPMEQAQAALHAFAQQAGPDRQRQLLQVLVGLFAVLDQERGSVIAGLDRFGSRQKELAAEIRADNEKLRGLQNDPNADPKAVQEMTQKVTWEVEVFQDRRQAISYACEVPGKIEQRLFALARQIQQELD
jgi:hypothetical protein